MNLLCGLGNPGESYAHTRHNIGFLVLEHLAMRQGASFKKRDATALHAKIKLGGETVLLLQPQTYMNESGRAVQKVFTQERLKPGDLIVVHDELDLPFGQIKLKQGGGDGGHRGLISITGGIGAEYVRVRLGIGRGRAAAGDRDRVVDHVLSPFSREEKAQLPEFFDRAITAIELILSDGLTVAQNRVH